MRVTAFTTMKNEGPFILEWIAYHRLIGVNDFLVFTDQCTDGSDLLVERLDELGLVRHMPNPATLLETPRRHMAVVKYVNQFTRLRRSDWVLSVDVDEFLCINTGDGTLTDLFAACPGAEAFSFNQLSFGCNGQIAFEDRPQIASFTRSDTYVGPIEGRRGVKSLSAMRSGLERVSNHYPHYFKDQRAGVNWLNGSGQRLSEGTVQEVVKSLGDAEIGYDLAQVNHYAVRSAESFLVKTARGNANNPEVNRHTRYWRIYNQNKVENTRILRMLPALTKSLEALKSDPELARLHDQCVAHHIARIATLKTMQGNAALLEKLVSIHNRRNQAAVPEQGTVASAR